MSSFIDTIRSIRTRFALLATVFAFGPASSVNAMGIEPLALGTASLHPMGLVVVGTLGVMTATAIASAGLKEARKRRRIRQETVALLAG